jgi:hypothetical protein
MARTRRSGNPAPLAVKALFSVTVTSDGPDEDEYAVDYAAGLAYTRPVWGPPAPPGPTAPDWADLSGWCSHALRLLPGDRVDYSGDPHVTLRADEALFTRIAEAFSGLGNSTLDGVLRNALPGIYACDGRVEVLVAADALADAGRDEEASLLRSSAVCEVSDGTVQAVPWAVNPP